MPLEEKNEKKSAKRVQSDPLFDNKHLFWNCEKEDSAKEKIYSPSVHATRTPSDTPKSLNEEQAFQNNSTPAENNPIVGGGGGIGGRLTLSVHKQQQPSGPPLSAEEAKKTAIVSTATDEAKVEVDQGSTSSKSTSSHSLQVLKLVPSRFSSTQLLKSRKGSMDSISRSRRHPKTTVSVCLKPSSPIEGVPKETLPKSVQDVVEAFLAKQDKQYTLKE